MIPKLSLYRFWFFILFYCYIPIEVRHVVNLKKTLGMKFLNSKFSVGWGRGGGEVVDISNNYFLLQDASNYKIFSFGLQM